MSHTIPALRVGRQRTSRQTAPDGPYVYQPYGMQDAEHWKTGRIYAIGGLGHLVTIKGLTEREAHNVVAALMFEGKTRYSA